MKKLYILLLVICSLFTISGMGQNSVYLAKKNQATLNLADFVQKTLTGKAVQDTTMWLNYSALVSPAEPGMSITAEIGSGQIPEGMVVFLEAKRAKGTGFEHAGIPTGKIQLGHVPKVILENIRTGYTGSGPDMGHQIIVSFEITDFSLIQPGMNSIYIQFTLK